MKPSELTDDQLIDLVEGPPYHLLHSIHLEYEDTGPGKFEGTANPGLTERLYTASLDTSWQDEHAGAVDECGLYAWRTGRFILTEDTYGFVDCIEFSTCETAAESFQHYHTSLARELDEGEDE